jgi:CRP/FNR family transcriptional regulator, nitrogen oxide reductase regulator
LTGKHRGPPALFEGMSDAEIQLMMDRATEQEFAARSWIFRQGDRLGNLCLVMSGLIRLSQITPEGGDILVRFVGPGEIFGYFRFSTQGPNLISAQAFQDSRLACWDQSSAVELLRAIPRSAINLLNITIRDVAYFYERSRGLLTDTAGRRVRRALLELARTAGNQTGRGVELVRGIGQREVAELAGTTIFTANRELGKIQREGIVEKSRGQIRVLKLEELAN